MAREGKNDSRMQMLHRIVAMLFALSALAERTTSRSRPIRRTLCWILGLAISPVREMISETGLELGFDIVFSDIDLTHSDDSADDLMCIAAALSELGRALSFLVAHIEQLDLAEREAALQNIRAHVRRCLTTLLPAFNIERARVPYPDTS